MQLFPAPSPRPTNPTPLVANPTLLATGRSLRTAALNQRGTCQCRRNPSPFRHEIHRDQRMISFAGAAQLFPCLVVSLGRCMIAPVRRRRMRRGSNKVSRTAQTIPYEAVCLHYANVVSLLRNIARLLDEKLHCCSFCRILVVGIACPTDLERPWFRLRYEMNH